MTAVSASRLEGLDLARVLAVAGMLSAHVGPVGLETLGGQLYALPQGRASVLFMLLAGVGVSFLAASRRPRRGGAEAQLLWRAALLFLIGLGLQALEPDAIYVILPAYAALFVLAIAMLRMPSPGLLAIAALMLALGPAIFLHGQLTSPEVFDRSPVMPGLAAGEMLHRLVLSGPYPLVTWIVPFAVGMWLGRLDLRSTAVRRRLVVVGAVGTAGVLLASAGLQRALGVDADDWGWNRLLVTQPHSQMLLWLAGSVLTAGAVLGLCLLLADRARRWLWPLIASGQLALTFYVTHLLVLWLLRETLESSGLDDHVMDSPAIATAVTLLAMAAFAAFAVLWRSRFQRGPLESLLFLPWIARRQGRDRPR